MLTIKIYKYMKKLDLKKEFFFQLFWRLAAMALCAVAAFSYRQIYFSVCISSFWAYSFFHHFFKAEIYTNYEVSTSTAIYLRRRLWSNTKPKYV